MIINLIREPAPSSDPNPAEACRAEALGVPAHRVAAVPFADAEAEVRRRVLRSLADRASPPTAIMFVRTWELPSIEMIAQRALDVTVDSLYPEPSDVDARLEALRVDAPAPKRRGRRG